jgi:hypothetical protein
MKDLSLQPLTGIPMAFVVLYLEEHLSSEKDQLAL